MSTYIFLNPDGTRDFGLLVIVIASTGVIYAQQCAGLATQTREIEGFAVPVGGSSARFVDFFHASTKERSRFCSIAYSDKDRTLAILGEYLPELQRMVAGIPLWRTERAWGAGERAYLELDLDRLDELTEAWLPVKTVYGPGVLVFENCD